MKILVSNDDGVYAPGLAILAEALRQDADELCVVAPDRNRSGASNALTLDRPLETYRHTSGYFSVNGTPTDCVHLGRSGLFLDGFVPDIVVSGINVGANLGDDVLYSGTVAAAMEGRTCRLPPIAVSMNSFHPRHFDTAAEIVRSIVAKLDSLVIAPRTVLNVNIPDLPMEQIRGIHVTRLGHRLAANLPVPAEDPRGKVRYWIAGAGDVADRDPGTDFFALEQHCVSVTPLQIDMTHYSGMDNLASWLEEL
ncbi:MAG: 5'/3'-nucleotidase SurE [Nitrincola lacisaponensis]|uniref:5'-nucleotidase SurE n=1 Tax=Nitrincola lacisaponensis TaxID=267850 RepID=A0A063Y5V3_9GAMM|nr:5'/3'-nucleotidase SurE [Nitrincola lacisaponensis]KDE40500.1 5-nucleotidase SurE [Nitrincola lacisaponensis]